MKDKVFAANQNLVLMQQQDTVLVGFSGGADSVALLHFLYSHRIQLGITVKACHINHNLRGNEALRDEHFAQSFCKRYNIPLDTVSLDIKSVAVSENLSVEHAARNERYRIFDLLSQKYNAKIATAHTLTDSMETIIFNMARGTGLKGLTGIPAKRGNIIRPLILLTRSEIEAYCESNCLDYVTDSTNL
ncbi:MAG: tRNA lysidine(34) synthetase TilS, partial [Oscillospiraceae bacterium]